MSHRFLALWKLIPNSCKYDVGQAPLRATYRFTPHAEEKNSQNPTKISVKI